MRKVTTIPNGTRTVLTGSLYEGIEITTSQGNANYLLKAYDRLADTVVLVHTTSFLSVKFCESYVDYNQCSLRVIDVVLAAQNGNILANNLRIRSKDREFHLENGVLGNDTLRQVDLIQAGELFFDPNSPDSCDIIIVEALEHEAKHLTFVAEDGVHPHAVHNRIFFDDMEVIDRMGTASVNATTLSSFTRMEAVDGTNYVHDSYHVGIVTLTCDLYNDVGDIVSEKVIYYHCHYSDDWITTGIMYLSAFKPTKELEYNIRFGQAANDGITSGMLIESTPPQSDCLVMVNELNQATRILSPQNMVTDLAINQRWNINALLGSRRTAFMFTLGVPPPYSISSEIVQFHPTVTNFVYDLEYVPTETSVVHRRDLPYSVCFNNDPELLAKILHKEVNVNMSDKIHYVNFDPSHEMTKDMGSFGFSSFIQPKAVSVGFDDPNDLMVPHFLNAARDAAINCAKRQPRGPIPSRKAELVEVIERDGEFVEKINFSQNKMKCFPNHNSLSDMRLKVAGSSGYIAYHEGIYTFNHNYDGYKLNNTITGAKIDPSYIGGIPYFVEDQLHEPIHNQNPDESIFPSVEAASVTLGYAQKYYDSYHSIACVMNHLTSQYSNDYMYDQIMYYKSTITPLDSLCFEYEYIRDYLYDYQFYNIEHLWMCHGQLSLVPAKVAQDLNEMAFEFSRDSPSILLAYILALLTSGDFKST